MDPGSALASNGAAERGALRGAVVVDVLDAVDAVDEADATDAVGSGETGHSTSISTAVEYPAEVQAHFGTENS